MTDKTLKCMDCGEDFIFTAGEQEFYASRGLQNEPKRCKTCRDAKKSRNNGGRRSDNNNFRTNNDNKAA